MSGIRTGTVALASLEDDLTWHLRIDRERLFRWYLDGAIETDLYGTAADEAVSALQSFVEQSLRGGLQILEVTARIGATSESGKKRSRPARA